MLRQIISALIRVFYVRKRAQEVGVYRSTGGECRQKERETRWRECRAKKKKENIGMGRWQGRGRIRTEAGGDVTMHFTPPAPALCWG